jgi:tRNA dimethylallyltransferase
VPAPFPIICGPTAGGKSALAIALAQRNAARGHASCILAADAFQVYKRMDIGTAKPSASERQGIDHRLIDLVEPSEGFSVQQWLDACEQELERCRREHIAPIVVGGTHLYVKALLEGLFEGPGADESLRTELARLSPEELRAELERVDPRAAARLHPNDLRRTMRAIEVFRLTGTPLSAHQQQWDAGKVRPDARLVILNWPVEQINARINARVKAMMAAGLLEEVRSLQAARALGPLAREALGYKQLIAHLEGRGTLEDAFEQIKIETRRFAKNQRAWLKRLSTTPGAITLDAAARSVDEMAERVDEALRH